MQTLTRTCLMGAGLTVATLALSSQAADASTVAYWRFEQPDWLADVSGNGHTLSNNGGNATNPDLPTTGAGSGFYDPIPQTGDSNSRGAQRGASTTNYLYAVDSDAFTSDTFTLELMVNADTRVGNSFLAGHWGSNRSYAIYMGGDGAIQLVLGTSTNDAEFVSSGFSLALDTDYYVAVTVDLTGATAAERTARFYLQNLTAGTALQDSTASGIGVSSVRNVSHGFTIGSSSGGGNGDKWSGLIDEVRLSNTALSRDELLAVIPEPASVALMALGGVLCLGRRRG